MKVDYLRLCSRASDNPAFIWFCDFPSIAGGLFGPGPWYNVEGLRKACAKATFRFPVPPYNIIRAKRVT